VTKIFVLGARTSTGGRIIQALQAERDGIFSDDHAFGESALLNRGFVLDQLRRFGPFDTFINVLASPADELICAADALPCLIEQPLRVLSAAADLWGESDRRLIIINGLVLPHAWAQSERLMLERLLEQAPRVLCDTIPALEVRTLTAQEAIKSPNLI
jgi:hypothetical protein